MSSSNPHQLNHSTYAVSRCASRDRRCPLSSIDASSILRHLSILRRLSILRCFSNSRCRTVYPVDVRHSTRSRIVPAYRAFPSKVNLGIAGRNVGTDNQDERFSRQHETIKEEIKNDIWHTQDRSVSYKNYRRAPNQKIYKNSKTLIQPLQFQLLAHQANIKIL